MISDKIVDMPLFIWEPVPALCVPAELEGLYRAAGEVEIVSPNAEELAGYFTNKSSVTTQLDMAEDILNQGIGVSRRGWLVVREGSKGCSAYSRRSRFNLRAYHIAEEASFNKVVDPTGGGNAFLGALGGALCGTVRSVAAVEELLGHHPDKSMSSFKSSEPRRILRALLYATVAASFVIEQPGMPRLSHEGPTEGFWNGETFEHRLALYVSRESSHIMKLLKNLGSCTDDN